ncbi:MAG: hypothetical protein ACRDMV_15315 [Streptosporangiales bacterium]
MTTQIPGAKGLVRTCEGRWTARQALLPASGKVTRTSYEPGPGDRPDVTQLELATDWHLARGAVVRDRTPGRVAVAYEARVNHVLHLLLTLVTFGFWVIVWAVQATRATNTRRVIVIRDDPPGVTEEEIRSD